MSRLRVIAAGLVVIGAYFTVQSPSFAADAAVKVPAAVLAERVVGHRETALFAGGCFWGVEGVFHHVKGVFSATSGYAGGTAATASYETVATGTTGHAEAVKVVFDPTKVNYADLLRIYFSVVTDPTEVNRQGPDEGRQYRTALFPQSATQLNVARAYIAQLGAAHVYPRAIVTKLEADSKFFPAEADHQNFMTRNPNYPYIVINDRPKVDALKRLFPLHYQP